MEDSRRKMLEDLVAFVEVTGMRPVVDATFAFEDVRSAYARLESGEHFGKIAVTIG